MHVLANDSLEYRELRYYFAAM